MIENVLNIAAPAEKVFDFVVQDLRRIKAVLEGGVSTAVESEPTETASIVRVPVSDLCALWAESATAPMNIALIGVAEGAPLTTRRYGRFGAYPSIHRSPTAESADAAACLAADTAWPGYAGLDRRRPPHHRRSCHPGSGRPADNRRE